MITILTPTYNRAYILHKAYNSLKQQTLFDFEWIIVDDGSSDETEKLVKSWIKSNNSFDIVYHKQKNGGKHRAVNNGVKLSKYDYIMILDSDDYLTDDAVEKVHYWISTISNSSEIVGVAGFRGYENGTTLGKSLPRRYIDITSLQRKKYKLMSDKVEVYKTEIMKKFPFPEFEGENFLRESASWDRIAQAGYKLRYFNEIIYICEYIEDGLTKNVNNTIYAKNFNGFTYCTTLYLETHSFPYDCLKIGHYYEVSKINNLSNRQIVDNLHISNVKLYFSLLLNFAKKTFLRGRKLIYGIHNTKSERC